AVIHRADVHLSLLEAAQESGQAANAATGDDNGKFSAGRLLHGGSRVLIKPRSPGASRLV
ncbi:MAG: hypothetical protein ACKOGB_01535, partial [Betaproteobacteria bacterium]